MKPIKLKLRGFLTYKNEIEIDFRKLYEKKVFLVAGDTGSGKTSIFDAIQFALYGKVSRGIDSQNLRSDFLRADELYTYVKLSFEVRDNVYEIERIPSQIAKRTKAGQDIKNSVALYDITEEKILLSEKIKETEGLVNEIIGLDYDQFSKVMLLAQGEFQEFLKARSDERTKLLSDIFKTGEYRDIQDKIKEKSKNASKNMEIIDERLESTIYRYDYISDKIQREDIMVHDFENILSSVENFKEKVGKDNDALEKEDKELSNKQNQLIEDRQKSITTNENIEKYEKIKSSLDKFLVDKESYEDLRNDIKKSKYAINIEVYDKRYKEALYDLSKSKEDLSDLTKKSEDIEKNIEESKKDLSKINELNESLNSIRISLNDDLKIKEDLDEFIASKTSYESLLASHDQAKTLEKDLEDISKQKEESQSLIADLEKSLNKKRIKDLDMSKTIVSLESEIKALEEKITIANKNKEAYGLIDKNEKELLELEEKENTFKDNLESYYDNQRLSEINKLIDELNQDNICPVCGDVHNEKFDKHEIQTIDFNSVTESLIDIRDKINKRKSQIKVLEDSIVEVDDLDGIGKNLETKNKNLEDLQKEIESTNALIDEKEKELRKICKNFSDILNQEDKLRNNLKSIKEKLQNFEEIKIAYFAKKDRLDDVDLDSLDKKIDQSKKEIKNIEDKINSINQRHNQVQNTKAKIESNIESTKKQIEKLEEDSKAYYKEFESKRKEVFEDIDSYNKYLDLSEDIRKREEETENFFKEIERLETLNETYKDFAKKDPIEISKIEENIGELRKEIANLSEKITYNKLVLANTKQTEEDIREIHKLYMDEKNESEILVRLAKVADGSFAKIAGREKIDFETFVLTYYFDRVLNFANIRLNSMTNGQFTMLRKSDADDLRSKWGLDIELLDANTGKSRPASTLSGGESFVASLSLALGLSDEISAENGGIRIDTLFIDEGFGTLSDDYLNKVIEQIEKLSYENKFIGIISHVKELKESIDAKIEVSYEADQGSFIEVKA